VTVLDTWFGAAICCVSDRSAVETTGCCDPVIVLSVAIAVHVRIFWASKGDILGLLVDDCHWEGDRSAGDSRALRLVEIGVHAERMLNMALLHGVAMGMYAELMILKIFR
jgi:hypothetical protein